MLAILTTIFLKMIYLPIGRISLNAQVAVEASAPLKAPTSLMCGMKATPAVPQQATLRIIGLAQLKGTMTDLKASTEIQLRVASPSTGPWKHNRIQQS